LNVTETTRRHESYNDSFNGALANQNIRRATEFNPHSNTSAAPSATLFNDQENVKRPPLPSLPPPPCRGIDPQCLPQPETTKKRPPSIFLPPPSPPRPIPVPLGDQESRKLPLPSTVFLPPPHWPSPQPSVENSNNRSDGSPKDKVGGVAMPATVVKSKPTDKADTSDLFGTDHSK
jgi:hypothetical protein